MGFGKRLYVSSRKLDVLTELLPVTLFYYLSARRNNVGNKRL